MKELGKPRRRPPWAVLRSILAGLLILLPLGLSPAQAAAAVDDQQVTITFDQMTPALPDRNGAVTLVGRVTNTSTENLTNTQVLFWRDQSPITERGSFEAALASPARQPWGSRVTREGAYQDLTTDADPTISPGETVSFRVSAKVSDLEFPSSGGVYLIGVHVLGRQGAKGSTTLGRSRLLLPLPKQGAPTDKQPVVSVVALSSRPSRTSSGVYTDDHLADELAPDGRLSALVAAAARDQVSWMVDPALIQEVEEMASPTGYLVDQNGQPVPGVGSPAARRWLAEFDRLDVTRGYKLPFGTPDLTPLAHQKMTDLAQRIQAASGQVQRLNSLPMVVWSTSSELDADTVKLAESFGPVAIFASNTGSNDTLLQPAGNVPVVSYSLGTFSGGPGPDPRATTVHQRQRMLAESLLRTYESPNEPVVHVLTSAAEASVDATTAPWMKRDSLGDLLDSAPREWPKSFDYTAQMKSAELNSDQAETLQDLDKAFRSYTDMLVEAGSVQVQSDAVLSRASSSWWRGNPDGFRAYVTPQVNEVRAWLTGTRVAVSAQKHVIMSGQSGSFPISVTNKSKQDLRVNLEFTSNQPQRLSIQRQENVIVGAGQSTTVNIHPHAAGNGPVEVSVQLTTPSGHPLGKRTAIVVEATNFGKVGWIIVVASGVVLLAATVGRIRQVRRERGIAEAHAAELNEPTIPRVLPVVEIPSSEGNQDANDDEVPTPENEDRKDAE